MILFSEADGHRPFDIPDPFGDDKEPVDVVAREIIDMIDNGYDQIISLARKMEGRRKENQ